MERVSFVVSGRVQGVWFRRFTQRKAAQLGLVGWVKNRRDGSVEGIAEGDRGRLQELLVALQRGPELARVTGVDAIYGEACGQFSTFDIVR